MNSQFSLSWDAYKSNICNGFTTLQQNGEFVDMTIAAEGHFVKVHQMLVALASPYLKDLITSAPCQHPVIFLNNVSHKVLCLLLEYMYTGEVVVPAEYLSSFAEAAKALHIRGLETISSGNIPAKKPQDEYEVPVCHVSSQKLPLTPEVNSLPPNATKIFVRRGPSMKSTSNTSLIDNAHDYSDQIDDNNLHDSDDGIKTEDESNRDSSNNHDNPSSKLQFTVSIRGSLQVILNRYMYNLHSTKRSGLRRWRCVDYRNNKCTAYVTTKGNVVLNRANLHNHPFHDKKILSKIEKKSVYSAIEEVESYKEKEMENERNADKSANGNDITDNEFMLLDEFDNNINVKSDK